MSKSGLSFEEALDRLENLVNRLEEGNMPLEESLKLFAEGIQLTKQCTKQLEQAEKKINLLLEDEDGNPVIKEEEL